MDVAILRAYVITRGSQIKVRQHVGRHAISQEHYKNNTIFIFKSINRKPWWKSKHTCMYVSTHTCKHVCRGDTVKDHCPFTQSRDVGPKFPCPPWCLLPHPTGSMGPLEWGPPGCPYPLALASHLSPSCHGKQRALLVVPFRTQSTQPIGSHMNNSTSRQGLDRIRSYSSFPKLIKAFIEP